MEIGGRPTPHICTHTRNPNNQPPTTHLVNVGVPSQGARRRDGEAQNGGPRQELAADGGSEVAADAAGVGLGGGVEGEGAGVGGDHVLGAGAEVPYIVWVCFGVVEFLGAWVLGVAVGVRVCMYIYTHNKRRARHHPRPTPKKSEPNIHTDGRTEIVILLRHARRADVVGVALDAGVVDAGVAGHGAEHSGNGAVFFVLEFVFVVVVFVGWVGGGRTG